MSRVRILQGSGELSNANPLPVSVVPGGGAPITPLNLSGTITAGGTAQQLAASNASRLGYRIRNVGLDSLWISATGTAVASHLSMEIKAGEYFECAGWAPTSAISIIGPTTGQAFFAEEW